MTLNVRTDEPPVIVNVPVRVAPLVLPVPMKLTAPFPLPLAPEAIVIQPALLAAVHPQPLVALTPTLPVPPLDVKEALGADSEYVQGAPD